MKEALKNIRVVGFDLDQTLFPKSSKIDDAIQEYIFVIIADRMNCSLAEAKKLFLSHYPALSGRKALMALGFSDAAQIIQESLEHADITPFLHPNPQVIALLEKIHEKFNVDLITGSEHKVALAKLSSLQIPLRMFSHVITGEISKSDGTAYKQWKDAYPDIPAEQFLYIGDRRKTDIDVPRALGMQALLVNVEKPKATDEFTSLMALHELLDFE